MQFLHFFAQTIAIWLNTDKWRRNDFLLFTGKPLLSFFTLLPLYRYILTSLLSAMDSM